MMLRLLAFSFTVCLALDHFIPEAAAATPFGSCATKVDPLELRVKGCSEKTCKMHQGESGIMEMDFEARADIENLEVTVIASVFGAKQEFPLSDSNACHSLTNAECPLDKWEVVTYRLELPIESSYPELTLPIEISVSDRNTGTVQACFVINVAVVPP